MTTQTTSDLKRLTFVYRGSTFFVFGIVQYRALSHLDPMKKKIYNQLANMSLAKVGRARPKAPNTINPTILVKEEPKSSTYVSFSENRKPRRRRSTGLFPNETIKLELTLYKRERYNEQSKIEATKMVSGAPPTTIEWSVVVTYQY